MMKQTWQSTVQIKLMYQLKKMHLSNAYYMPGAVKRLKIMTTNKTHASPSRNLDRATVADVVVY